MLRQTPTTRETTHDRRGIIALTTSAAVITCALAGVLAACGGGGQDEGYVAVERPASGGTAVAPTGEVTFVPLEGRKRERERETAPDHLPSARESRPRVEEGGNSGRTSTSSASTPTAPTSTSAPTSTPVPPQVPTAAPTPPPSPPVGPARLITGALVREGTDRRWCEKVTLPFRNTGGAPVRSGTVTFGTHIIDLLGTDWATVESKVPLPTPIGAGASGEETWTVCVEAWRVPWGMRVETRVVGVDWA